MSPVEWGVKTRSGASLLAVVKQCGESPCRSLVKRQSRVLKSPMIRVAATFSMLVLTVHLVLSHNGVYRKHTVAPKLLLLPDGTPVPKQVEALNSCPHDMPLLQEEAGVLEQSKLAELQASLRNSTWLMPLGRRTGRLGSKGVSVTFNTNGVEQLLQGGNLTKLASFFAAERLPVANAWVMTLLAVEGCPGFQADQGIWEIHRDELPSARGQPFKEADRLVKIFPHSVTVFAVDKPANILGGATWLWLSNSSSLPAGHPPAAVVAPEANAKYTFRGDAFHGFSGQNSTNATLTGATISIILEQYKVSTELYAQTVDYRVRRFVTEYRAKRPDKRVYQSLTEEQRHAAAALLRQPTERPDGISSAS